MKPTIGTDEYQQKAQRTFRESEGNLAYLTLGLCGEAGEVAELVKKSLKHGIEIDKQKMLNELGDVLWYVTMLGKIHGFSLSDIGIANIEKLEKRYPDGFVQGGGVR